MLDHPPAIISSRNPRTSPGHSPEKIASTVKVRDVKISPDGAFVLYQVQPFYKAPEGSVSELWLAKTDIEDSAKQLTDGKHNDRAGVWHPDSRSVFFLSDRHAPGKPAHIFFLAINEEGVLTSDPQVAIGAGFGKKGVQGFEISPDGENIAFTSVDDPSSAQLQKVHEKNDAVVVGVKSGLPRLRILNLAKQEVMVVDGIREDMYMESYTWSADGRELLYRMRQNRGAEYSEMEVILERITTGTGQKPSVVGSYSRTPSGQNIYLPSGHIATLQSYEPSNPLDARTLYVHSVAREASLLDENKATRLYGIDEDAVRIVNMRSSVDDPEGQSMIAVEVCRDVDTRVDVVVFDNELEGGACAHSTLFKTDGDAVWFGAWDAKRVIMNGEISYIFAAVLSSGPRHEPPNVWAGRALGTQGGLFQKRKLSSHLQWLVNAPELRTEVIYWKTLDGANLSGLIRFPPGYTGAEGPLPTVLFIHGGPYRRDIPDYMPYFCNWRELFASAGYIVISPNYRGSQGRGHKFAYAASQGIGNFDWPDCESMVDEVIQRGIADPNRLGVAGWSHGGSLTAWGVTKTKTRFKAAIVGAGATNWESMVLESAAPELEAVIGQSTPWNDDPMCPSQRKTSPVHHVSGVTTAVLIMHGEKDERVPLGQAVGFWRGIKRKAADRGREAVQLVIYPREPHGFVEQKHAEDVLQRVLEYFDTYME